MPQLELFQFLSLFKLFSFGRVVPGSSLTSWLAIIFAHYEVQLARDIRNNIPVAAFQLIMDDEWKGGELIHVKEKSGRPSASELARNAMWLTPICCCSPKKAR